MWRRSAGALTAALLLSLAAPAVAGSVAVRGAVACAQWRADRGQESFGARLAEMWLLGYLSGLAVARGDDVLRGRDSASVFSAVDAWCAANPQGAVDDAADDLYARRAAAGAAR